MRALLDMLGEEEWFLALLEEIEDWCHRTVHRYDSSHVCGYRHWRD